MSAKLLVMLTNAKFSPKIRNTLNFTKNFQEKFLNGRGLSLPPKKLILIFARNALILHHNSSLAQPVRASDC